MGAERKHEQVPAHDEPVRMPDAGPAADRGPSVAAATPAGQASRIADATLAAGPASPGLAGPPRFDLGDRAVGTTHIDVLSVFNIESLDAYVRVSYEGSPSISLVSAPTRLRPSREGLDPTAAIRIAFSPLEKGRAHGTIVVHAAWQNGVRTPMDLRIPIEAAAHEVGGKPIAEEEADEHAAAEKARNDAGDRAQMDQAMKAADERLTANKVPGTAAMRRRLDRAEGAARDALADLFDNRRAGIDTAKEEAEKFKRRVPEHHESLLETLAFAALDVATAGLAGALGKRLETALLRTVKVAEHTLPAGGRASASEYSPSRAVVAFFTDSFKDVVKRGAKAGRTGGGPDRADTSHDDVRPNQAGATKAAGEQDPGPSSDPLIAFFQTEKIGLIHQHRGKATEVAQNARFALEPMLDTHPMQAIASLDAIAHELTDYASRQRPANLQAQASAMHWIQYVAQASLGSVAANESRAGGRRARADGATTTNLAGANMAPTGGMAPTVHDGLVDVELEVDHFHPANPAIVRGVRVHGVSKNIGERLARDSLRAANVAVRAYSLDGLEAVRDEAGNIDYSDNTGAPGMPGNWFARKAGEPSGGRDAALRGARALIEDEVLTYHPQKQDIETDSET